eukprot:SAG31_NODE_3118_length_4656_cov_3.081413_5_plen_203_part_00
MNSAEGQTSHALHTHPIATDAVKPRKAADAPPDSTAPPSSSSAPEEELISLRYTHAVEGYVDASRKLAPEAGVFGWDDVIVLLACGKTYHELKTQCNLKYSPRVRTAVLLSLGFFMELFLLNLPHTHREIYCLLSRFHGTYREKYGTDRERERGFCGTFLVFMGLIERNTGLIQRERERERERERVLRDFSRFHGTDREIRD